MGLPDNIKTRSLKIIDFVANNNLIQNKTQGQAILSHNTGISKNDFINTDTFCKRLQDLFEPEEIFENHIPEDT